MQSEMKSTTSNLKILGGVVVVKQMLPSQLGHCFFCSPQFHQHNKSQNICARIDDKN